MKIEDAVILKVYNDWTVEYLQGCMYEHVVFLIEETFSDLPECVNTIFKIYPHADVFIKFSDNRYSRVMYE